MQIDKIKTSKDKKNDDLTIRLRQLLEIKTEIRGRFNWLEKNSDISSETWKSWWNRNSVASANMILTISKMWPEHAFWIVTGIEDKRYGHVMPRDFNREGDGYFESAISYQMWRENAESMNASADELRLRLNDKSQRNQECNEIEREIRLMIKQYNEEESLNMKMMWSNLIDAKAQNLKNFIDTHFDPIKNLKNETLENAKTIVKKQTKTVSKK